MKFPLLALTTAMLLQVGMASPAALLKLERPLTTTEIETVVSGIRQAMGGRTLRLIGQRGGEPEILMRQNGTPRMIRYKGRGESIAGITGPSGTVRVFSLPDVILSQFEYLPGPARRCNGVQAASGMVIEYLQNLTLQVRQVTAREPGPRDAAMARPLEMLRVAATLASGGRRLISERYARALVSPLAISDAVVMTGDPAPNPADFVPIQSLWIDTDSLLPVRWEVTQRQAIVGAIDFVYERLDLRRPAGFDVPQCIP